MNKPQCLSAACLFIVLACYGTLFSQSSTGTISGTVTDENKAVIPGAAVTAKNTATGFARSTTTNSAGIYRLIDIPTGTYEVIIEAPNFWKYIQSGITLDASQNAKVDTILKAGNIQEVVTVNENVSALNTTTAEVATRFDERRLSELPIASNRSVFNILFSVPGVSQLGSGQAAFANGISFSANGGRVRSNSFLLDGQDINDTAITGIKIPLNNPDAIQEVRIVTNQFLPEYGRNSGSVVNIVGKSGTNDFHGSVFWFHNNEYLNACSNLDKRASGATTGFCNENATTDARKLAPRRLENQIGFTIGGPVIFPRFGEGRPYFSSGRDKTFFFTDYQRWSDRQQASGVTLNGSPTQAGRAALQANAGNRPQVQALLRFVPAGTPNGQSRTVSISGGPTFNVELGNLTGSSALRFDSHQGSFRVDHRINENNLIYGRYRYSYASTTGTEQITPPGLATVEDRNGKAAAIVWTSVLSPRISNEARIAWARFDLVREAEDPQSASIPSIEINDLGMTGFNAARNRTAFGLATNLPVVVVNDTYQVTEAVSIFRGKHSFKFGVDLRRTDEKSFFLTAIRGRLLYTTLSNFVNDSAQTAARNLPLRGGDVIRFYRWHEFYGYVQDQWKVLPNLTLSYGVRYEYPGDSFQYLRDLNQRVLAANNNDPALRFEPEPKIDTNNWMPRIGFNWNPQTSDKGVIGFVTGGNRMVIRGGYARTYDAHFIIINQNIANSFPFVATQNTSLTNAFTTLINTTVPNISNPRQLSRTVVSGDFRAAATDQFSLDIQRELSADLILKIGYVRTRGTGLLQTIDGNPRRPCPFGTGPGTCNTTGIDRNTGAPLPPGPPVLFPRVDPTRGQIRLITNSASSTYDALQTSLEKRLSRGVSFGVHYTWSAFLDTASDIFEQVPQDSFDRNADRARSSYDRPHRLSGNIVYELPFFRKQEGFAGKLLGGWQVNSFFNFQTGAPFSPLNGSDPAGALEGFGGNAIRPNVFTNLDVSRISTAQLFIINQQLRAQAIAQAQQIFNALPSGPCIPGFLPGPPLPFTLFSAPRGRITCGAQGRTLVIDFNGVLEGQRVGNAGRNILRADGLRLVDIGIIKNTQIGENVRVQFWTDLFNAFNSRNFGIPSGIVSSPDFLNQSTTDGGSRRIRFGARLSF
ncbi:MAG: carboxypeptidase regulatory-like domain-containing protein [Pyrinomonadaceae bacterium]